MYDCTFSIAGEASRRILHGLVRSSRKASRLTPLRFSPRLTGLDRAGGSGMSSPAKCPFCDLGPRIVAQNELAAALRDKEPASRGHTLVVPKRHCKSFFDLTADEVGACYALLLQERAR